MSTDLENAQIAAQAQIRTTTVQAVTQAWNSLPHYDRANLDEWLTKVLPLILAAQRQSAAVTRAYLARALETPVPMLDAASLVGAAVRNGTPPATVYERSFVTVWTDLARGVDWHDAVSSGLDRATSTAEMDVQLAQTHTVAAVTAADDAVTGFRRVPDPGACDLCLIASTQRYNAGDLLPIHNRCGCTVSPIVGGPSSRVIDRDLLRRLKQDGAVARITAQRKAARARKESGLDVAVRDHGELGPLLTNSADSFTTEHQLH